MTMSRNLSLALVLVAAMLFTETCGKFVLEPTGFLKLPDRVGNFHLYSGGATKASYDPVTNFLYVMGHDADLLHVVNMTEPNNPYLLETKIFSMVNMGLPDSIQVCRGGTNYEFLAMGFESKDQEEKSHLHLFRLLDEHNYQDNLEDLKHHVTLDGYDPKAMGWKKDCHRLLVANKGEPHNITDRGFIDPEAKIEIIIPRFGATVDRVTLAIDEDRLSQARVRQVFRRCDEDDKLYSRTQDLQPSSVTVDDNDIAYIAFQDNNAIGTLDLKDPQATISYYDLGRKDWSTNNWAFDGSFEDSGMNLISRKGVESFYQPGDIVTFNLDGKVWLATADTGSYRHYGYSQCTFEESVAASDWNQAFADNLTPHEQKLLNDSMKNSAEFGKLRVSRLRSVSDGWDAIHGGYDFVATYGGRGFSILDASNMQRVYDSGDDLERRFTTSDITEAQRTVYNADVGPSNTLVSSRRDHNSPRFGPQPSAIAVASINANTQVLMIANGQVGGLHIYAVTPGPAVTFHSFVRRGQTGNTWDNLYATSGDAVGEPLISDLLYFEDEGQRTVVTVSDMAGAISVYRLNEV